MAHSKDRYDKRQEKRSFGSQAPVRKFVFALLAAAALFASGPAAAGDSPVVLDRVVAVVNGEVITMSDLQREMSKRTEIKDQRIMLDDMIDRKLQMAEAKKTGLDVTDKELGDAVNDIMKRNNMDQKQFEAALAKEGLTLEQYRTEFREQMTISRLFNKYVRTGLTVDDAEVRAYYDNNREQYLLPEEIRIRHLVIEVPRTAPSAQVAAARERADALLGRLRAGEDFIRLIRENSSGSTAAQDGDLGFLQLAHALPEIAEAAKGLKPGESAGPIRTEDGFQIIRVEEVRRQVIPFEKVKEEITKMLFEQKMENSYRSWLQTLRTESHIENRL